MELKNITTTVLFIFIGLTANACSTRTVISPDIAATTSGASRYNQLKQEMSELIGNGMRKHKVTGMSVALVDDGEIVWAQGFGYQDKTQNIPATTNTLYKAGSISKLFAATAIMQLVEQGKVDLDAPIQTYIPELKPKYHDKVDMPITLRLIMSHRSGLSSDMFAGWYSRKPAPYQSELDYLNSVHAPYAPGAMTAYSNLASDLMGIVIERVTGEQFEDYIDKHIFTLLGMQESTFRNAEVNQQLLSKAYRGHKEHEELPLRNIPSGNLYSNVMDLGRFAAMVMNHGEKVLSSKSMAAMLQEQKSPADHYDAGMTMGLNWMLKRPGLEYLGQSVWHSGETLYFHSNITALPQQGLAVVVLANSASAMPLINEISNSVLQRAANIKQGIQIPQVAKQAGTIPVPEELLQTVPGTYNNLQLGRVIIRRDGDKLQARLSSTTLDMEYHQDGWFSLHYKLFGLIPIPVDALESMRFKFHQVDGKQILRVKQDIYELDLAPRIQSSMIPSSWHKAIGKYLAVAKDDDFSYFREIEIKMEDGFLVMSADVENRGKLVVALKPIADDMAVLEGIGRWMQQTVYLSYNDGIPVLQFSGTTLNHKD